MSKCLVILESPGKESKLRDALESYDNSVKWQTLATGGHFCDLPKRKLGIDIANGFALDWKVSRTRVVSKIKKAAAGADKIYLALDADREGEAISQQVFDILKQYKPKRLRIYEITKQGVRDAFSNISSIDEDLVEAQHARRALDRLIGYKISPICWRGLGAGTSAGRVQSCVLSHVLSRDIERRKHNPEPYYEVAVPLSNSSLVARSIRLKTAEEAETVKRSLRKTKPVLTVSRRIVKPPPPFHTASALSYFSAFLKVGAGSVARGLQRLYETGYITYCRTDSLRLAPAFVNNVREHIKKITPQYLDSVRTYKSRDTAQGAHEAIRPTDLRVSPSSPELAGVGSLEQKIYTRIWARSIATQAKPAIVEDQLCEWQVNNETLVTAHGTKYVDLGWHVPSLKLFFQEGTKLPKSPKLDLDNAGIAEKVTEPPPKFSWAQIVRWMESKGVGRPATYSAIIYKLQQYQNIGRGAVTTTLRGEALTYFLEQVIPDLLDPVFTAKMERKLDKIAKGKASYEEVLEKYWNWLQPQLSSSKLLSSSRCNQCKDKLRVRVKKKRPPYLLCSKCKNEEAAQGSVKRTMTRHKQEHIAGECPECHSTVGFLTVASPRTGIRARCNQCKRKIAPENVL